MSAPDIGSGHLSPREHVEKIRHDRFYIGKEDRNPLAEDMHQAVSYLSEELYSKDIHFLMELIQNAEDNEYPSNVSPSLEFVLTWKDITATGATSTLIIFNNEKGFSPANIESICRIGKSTKKAQQHRGYIGEKGIGFKSVFLVSSQPHIFSNGYQIKFNEEPTSECGIGYIVPEWVGENQILISLNHIYGSGKSLPSTIIVLPLKTPKIEAVRKELSDIYPEILLFLCKIRKLSVREICHNTSQQTALTEVSISSEKDYETRKSVDAESYTLHLEAVENGNLEQCPYYMWKQNFPVKPECHVKKREGITQWTIVLAFPHGQRLNGAHTPGIYAFLPTEMVTNFPFVIQADFLLASSRETILYDSPWNKGILECIPLAFVNALVSLLKSTTEAPAFSLPPKLKFLPIQPSPLLLLESVRLSIKNKVLEEHVIPCESFTEKKLFCKPGDARRITPTFFDILFKAQSSGLDLQNLSSHSPYVLSYCFEIGDFDDILGFLGIKNMSWKWYAMCIQESELVMKAPEGVYMMLLCFLAENWQRLKSYTQHIPIVKYEDVNGVKSACSISQIAEKSPRVCIASRENEIPWLLNWNQEFGSISDQFFMPLDTQSCLKGFHKRARLMEWLSYAGIEFSTVYNYGCEVSHAVNDQRLAIVFAHFLYHSQEMGYINNQSLRQFCALMPVIDNYGNLITRRSKVLVPARGSKWFSLMGSNLWRSENYIELSREYEKSCSFAGTHTPENKLLHFIQTHVGAADVPYIYPPNAYFPAVYSPLTKENAILLLEWIRNMISDGVEVPKDFLNCVKSGSWIKTSVGYRPPKESFFCSLECRSLFQIGYDMVQIPIIDQEFYGNVMSSYTKELQTIGVKFEFCEASELIGKQLTSLLVNGMSNRSSVLSLLGIIRYFGGKQLSPSHLIETVRNGRWLLTSFGYKTPSDAVLPSPEWVTVSCIANIPFVDEKFYGESIKGYKHELELLGVRVSFRNTYNDLKVVVEKLKFPPDLSTAEAFDLLFKCICHVGLPQNYLEKLMHLKWLKTNQGFRAPSESMLPDQEWICLSSALGAIPVIDVQFYGDVVIRSYREELRSLGVVVRFEESSRIVSSRFMKLVSESSITKENVLSLLKCCKQLKGKKGRFPIALISSMKREKWLQTTMGLRAPGESILFHSGWESISSLANVPFIEFSNDLKGYRDELRELGVAITLEEGARFILKGINLPMDLTTMSASSSLLLLKCMKCWGGPRKSIPKEFIDSMKKKWLKTVLGYQCPEDSLLYDPKHSSLIQRSDGPFIDEEFYGSEIALYKEQLRDIGVKVDMSRGCSLVAHHLKLHSEMSTIKRIYMFLKEFKWQAENRYLSWIWVPCEDDKGDWVHPKSCVLHDNSGLFGLQLHVLENFYDKDLLGFFSTSLYVKYMPSVEDYVKLWRQWENSTSQIPPENCLAFWDFIGSQWNQGTEKLLIKHITKLPVFIGGSIVLANKLDVFVADDVLLKDLFDESLYVWYPVRSVPSLPRSKLTCIYTSLGVRKFSEAVEKHGLYKMQGSDSVTTELASSNVIKEGLIRIVLAFLANPCHDIGVEVRHEMVQLLLDLKIVEVDELVTMQYKVTLSGGRQLDAKITWMFFWEREESRLFIRRSDEYQGMWGKIKFATYFSDEISQGLLHNRTDLINSLAELIKVGCLLEYEGTAMEFLIKNKNLQLFAEDEEFLLSRFGTEIEEEINEEMEEQLCPSLNPTISPSEGQPEQGNTSI